MNEDIYTGKNPVDLPRYTYRDAGRATGVPATTVAAWFRGQAWHKGKSAGFFKPVLQRPDFKDPRLSYNNLLEVHILRALRTTHEVRLEKVREAILTAEQKYNVPRLLLSNQLHAGGGELFLSTYSELVHITIGNQTVMRDLFVQYLKRITVEEAETDLLSFYPFPKNPALGTQKLILVSPHVAFGAAVISRLGVTTATIASRADAGEERASIVEDYGLQEDEFDEAVLYEAA
ncbi:MAG: DUF433 domain-containing protein [Gemmatimonadales bacterium]